MIDKENKIISNLMLKEIENINEDIITLFAWLNLENRKTSIKDTIAYYEEIKKNNYIKIGRYTISKSNEITNDDVKKEIEEKIKDKQFLERTINKNKLADIWINTSRNSY